MTETPLQVKMDENPGNRGADLFRAAGHDAATVAEEGLDGTSDVS